MSKRRPKDVVGRITKDGVEVSKPRRSRAKPQTDSSLGNLERTLAAERRRERPAQGKPAISPAVWSDIRETFGARWALRQANLWKLWDKLKMSDKLTASVDPAVDRRALIEAVLCPDFENEVSRQHFERGSVDAQQAFRWLLLCRVRAAMDELRQLADALGDAAAPAREDDPRNAVPVTKEALWRVAHPGRDPRNTAEVPRWYAAKVCGPQGCDPDPPDPRASRRRVTVNLRLFHEKCCPRVRIDEVRRQLP